MERLTPKEAARFLQEDPRALFIDCRSEREYRFVGHPVGAVHLAWNDGPAWEINPEFVGEALRLAERELDRPVALICRTGDRAIEAGKALEAAGFGRVLVVQYGFEGDVGENFQRGSVNGWRFEGLPWEISRCGNCGS